MASSLRDDLASLSIDRGRKRPEKRGPVPADPRGISGDGGLRLLSVLIWLIPLGLLAGAAVFAYRQYDKLRAKPQVTIGLVQEMTTGEAEKLLSAKGYLTSRHQALIGAKIPGRVERMLVDVGSKVKKGDVMVVLEHNELNALLASRKAMLLRNEAELQEARVDLKQKEREANRADRLNSQRMLSVEEREKAGEISGRWVLPRRGAPGGDRADARQHPGNRGGHPDHAPLRPVRRHRRREAGRGGRGHHPFGDEHVVQPIVGRHMRTWR